MSVLREILHWAETLPDWQSDALRRLFATPVLSPQDQADLGALLKAKHGIPDPEQRTAIRLNANQVPVAATAHQRVTLVAMRDLHNVNAIAERQRLEFGGTGITVVYGDNGSGKSGYARVLKRACRARDQTEPILPDARQPAAEAVHAEAVFELSAEGVTQEAKWVDGEAAPEVLSTLSLFDARCARAYVDEENDLSYVPYGLDILEGLAALCKHLEVTIRDEHARNAPDLVSFAHLTTTNTAVGGLLTGLSAATLPDEVEALATLTPAEMGRHEQLGAILNTANPREQARQLRLCAARILKLALAAEHGLAAVGGALATKLHGLAQARDCAATAADVAAAALTTDSSLLPGTGGDVWKRLYAAARAFLAVAHPGKELGELGPEVPCPLCQQPLGGAAGRLVRFDQFVQGALQENARETKETFDRAYQEFVSDSVDLGLDDELYAEVEALDGALACAARSFGQALVARQQAIQEACKTGRWEGAVAAEPPSPAAPLQGLAARLEQQAADLLRAADDAARPALEADLRELSARSELAKVRTAVLSAVAQYGLQERLNRCLAGLKTNAISLKASELAEKAVTRDLQDALRKEFGALGVADLNVSLQHRSLKGKARLKLKLGFPQARNVRDILSEGEQRAIAIASFLAEVGLAGGKGGIIFDDPVSSLDHRCRDFVAGRLVSEAVHRQVIVFTHDVYFVCVVTDQARRQNVPCATRSLTRRPEGFGVPATELPFEAMGTKARVGALRAMHQAIAKLHRQGDEPGWRRETVSAYCQLRLAWERAVEEVLLGEVVLRFRKGVETQRLSGVDVEDDDCRIIEQAMGRCSDFAHDQAALGTVSLPRPDQLLSDIEQLESWRSSVEGRRKSLRERRKGAPGTGRP